VDVSEPASISTGIAARYATAMFELAQDGGALDALEADVAALDAAMADSADLSDLIASPIYGRDETQAAIGGVADAMGLNAITGNTLRLMAQKRRLFVLPALLRNCASGSRAQGRGHGRCRFRQGADQGAVRQAAEIAVGLRGP
jgi:F-type H+-transporting ATPase subunit delta